MITLKDADSLPDQPGVYFFNVKGIPHYIGKSVNIRARVKSHIHQAKLSHKERAIVELADSITYDVTLSNFDALIHEAHLIQKFQPKYNVSWKDDKNYLYLKITVKDLLPRCSPVRKENDGKSRYFGPFRSTYSTEKLLYELRKIVPFSTHQAKAGRACFYAKLGYCHPCPNLILKEKDLTRQAEMIQAYKRNVRKVIEILSGKSATFASTLERQLKDFSDAQRYEEAIDVRTKLFQLTMFLHGRSFDDHNSHGDLDMTALENQLKAFLREHFSYPIGKSYRVECYDISNLYGKEPTGSMVVFADGMFARKEYRKFGVHRTGISDIHMMEEVVSRRMTHTEWQQPDLMVIDGGTPQLRMISEYFRKNQIDIPLISLAKRPDRVMVAYNGYHVVPLDRRGLLFKMLQALRDESHRFAKKYHVELRNRHFLQ